MSEHHYQLAFDFIQQEPRAAARLLEAQNIEHISPFLTNTPAPTVAKLIAEMQPEFAAKLLTTVAIETVQTWVNNLDARQLSAVLRRLQAEQQQLILAGLTLKSKTACQLLLRFRDDMVGSIMATDIIAFAVDMNAGDCVKRLKQRHYSEQQVAFSVDENKKLIGELSLVTLLQANKNTCVNELDKPCSTFIPGRTLIASALSHPAWHGREILAVVNRQKELLGLVRYSQVRDALTSPTTKARTVNNTQHAAVDIIQAHGDSMRALLDVLLQTR